MTGRIQKWSFPFVPLKKVSCYFDIRRNNSRKTAANTVEGILKVKNFLVYKNTFHVLRRINDCRHKNESFCTSTPSTGCELNSSAVFCRQQGSSVRPTGAPPARCCCAEALRPDRWSESHYQVMNAGRVVGRAPPPPSVRAFMCSRGPHPH